MKSTIPNTLFILIFTNLLLFLFTNQNLNPPIPSQPSIDPITILFSRLSLCLMVYLSSMAYLQQLPSLQTLLFKIQQTWKRPALTLLYLELYSTSGASLLLMLKSLAKATREGELASVALVVFGSVGLVVWLSPVLFAHSDIACKLSLVMSVMEEEEGGGWEGMEAVERAEEILKGRRLQGYNLNAVMAAVEGAPVLVFGGRRRSWIVFGPVWLGVKFLVWFGYTLFYFECKKGSHGSWRGSNEDPLRVLEEVN